MPPATRGRAIATPVPICSILFSDLVSGVVLGVKANAGVAVVMMAKRATARKKVMSQNLTLPGCLTSAGADAQT